MRHAGTAAAFGRSLDGLWAQVFARPVPASPPDVDEDLYGGFVGNDDRRKLERLRGLGAEALVASRPTFDDPRLAEMLFRYRARNFPEHLGDDDRARWLQHCSERLHDGVGGGPTLAAFFERIDELAETADERGQEILAALYDYAESIAPEAD